jgi:ferredoxin like protein
MRRMKIDELLSATSFDVDDGSPHIVIDSQACRTCPSERACELSCPAQRYKWDEVKDVMAFDYVGCLECGNCRLVCDRLFTGAEGYSWNYPENGSGVTYRFG